METKPKNKPDERSFIKKISDFLGLRRVLLLLFAIIYVIKNYIKSDMLSDPNSTFWSLWEDKKPELPSRNPLFYATEAQTQTLPNRAKLMLKLTMLVFLILVILKRLNSANNPTSK